MMARVTDTLLSAGLALGAGALFLLPGSAAAQDGDARWLPFVGCWQAVSETPDAPALCFRPDGEGVEVLTVEDGQVTAREALRADGQPREQTAEGCTGTDVLDFSRDGRRLYLTSDQVCEGGTRRSATGIIAMVSPVAWIDVKSVEVEGERVSLVQLYRLAGRSTLEAAGLAGLTTGREMAVRTARIAAASAPTPDQVVEASSRVHEQAVQAWLAEAAEPFNLSASLVESLADAGVSPATIDVMVAVSYPDRFVLDRDARPDQAPAGVAADRTGEAMAAYGMTRHRAPLSPFRWDPFYASAYGYYGYYGLGYGYGISSYGSGFGAYYPFSGWLGYRPTVVIVQPDQGPGGRVINGQGYTRRSGGTATGSSYPTGRGTVGSGSTPPSSSGTAGSTTRRAKPRGGGGGDLF